MMLIERNANVSAEELNALLATQKWDMPLDKLELSMKSTWGWITARNEQGELTGFVRVFSDGFYHAYILHLLVHPNYQHKGIGTAVMKELMRLLGEHRLMPTLVATPGNVSFYRKFGFETQMNGLTAMCIRGLPYWENEGSGGNA
ncbi:GNAT family N-acetyltransferase [Paenibacillus oenotherae]|uniref:GNAT family N-acetyltransferase n=1 Tax=Paenibacillus oenotherae TaxID=1435645 RepID=A0ABS7DD02_9BACL|nr:GNAT family N-acetyltransferase [Paenibacillus oenotherae]MBW7477531.1 GNAT family N-acetyltransferase [Paenibacillus oenotherae]